MRKIIFSIIFIMLLSNAHAQDWVKKSSSLYYFNGTEKVYMSPDYSSYAVYFKEQTPTDLTNRRMQGFQFEAVYQRLKMAKFTPNASSNQRLEQSISTSSAQFLQETGLASQGAFEVAPSFQLAGQQVWFTQQVIIKLNTVIEDTRLRNILHKYDAQVLRNELSTLLQVATVSSQLALLQELQQANLIVWGQPNFQAKVVKHDDPLLPEQFQMHNTGGTLDGLPLTADIDIDALEAWGITTGSSSITVAVIDDGVERHPDLPPITAGFTPANNGNGTPIRSTDAHGLACAGIIAAQHNDEGVRGVAPNVNLLAINIFTEEETAQDLADAFTWAKDQGADVISNSWGYGTCATNPFPVLTAAINDAADNGRGDKGSVILFASGNDYGDCVSYPSNIQSVISVGAVNPNGNISRYSNQGPELDIVAPSNDINSSRTTLLYGVRTTDRVGSAGYNNTNYADDFGGTSAACPAAAGAAALVLSVNPDLTSEQVFDILINTADDMGASGFDNTFGHGRVNAHQAVLAANSGGGDTEAPSTPTGVTISNVTSNTATVSWNASSDNVEVTGYTVFLNGSSIGNATSASVNLTGLSASTAYSVSVVAFDAAGNQSAASSAASFTTTGSGGGSTCASTISSFPYTESFESGIGWTQASGDDGDWVSLSVPTPSNSTGPTAAAAGSQFVYLEASSNNTAGAIGSNATATLESPCFDLTSESSASLTFQYHMYGADMGSLVLQANNGAGWVDLWSLSGDQGNSWQSATINLANYAGTVVGFRFVGTTGDGWQSDMAIDAISVTTGAAPTPTSNEVTLTIVLDDYPAETNWEITDGSGTPVASGGSYSGAGSTVTETITLADGCYTFTITDSYGDGICCTYGDGSYSLSTEDNTTLASGGAFGPTESTDFCVGNTVSRSLVTPALAEQSTAYTLMYPNPATDFLNVQTPKGTQKLEVYGINGAVMQKVRVTEQGVDVSQLSSGIYLLVITTEKGVIREKFSKQ